jgi:hypothetical protein
MGHLGLLLWRLEVRAGLAGMGWEQVRVLGSCCSSGHRWHGYPAPLHLPASLHWLGSHGLCCPGERVQGCLLAMQEQQHSVQWPPQKL